MIIHSVVGEISCQEVEGRIKFISKYSKNKSSCHSSAHYHITKQNYLNHSYRSVVFKLFGSRHPERDQNFFAAHLSKFR
jgi:hypothetical protein